MNTEDLRLGSLVAFGRTLERKTQPTASSGTATKTWEPVSTNRYRFPERFRRPDGRLEGLVVGIRTLHNGTVNWGYYDVPTTFYAKDSIEAVLVTWHLRRNPVLVLPADLEVIEP